MSENKQNKSTNVETPITRGENPRVIVITGPTASGKTRLAVNLAKVLKADIISADSRQIFRGIPVTTAVPADSERENIKHHLLEVLNLDEYYSAAKFADDATLIINEISRRDDKYVIVAGGSMMYIDALLYGLDDLPEISDKVRLKVKKLLHDQGQEGLLALLEVIDPEYFQVVDKANTKRVVHALEISMQAGVPYSSLRTGKKKGMRFDAVKFALDLPRKELFMRINMRVEEMVAQGMEEEARRVYPHRDFNSLNTVGFKEWFSYFDGILDRETAIERIKKNTRVYAKKQLTWLKKDNDVIMLSPETALQQILSELHETI